jgi:hypothetical protein
LGQQKNKGLASSLTAFVEKLGKTPPCGELNTNFSKGLVTFPRIWIFP